MKIVTPVESALENLEEVQAGNALFLNEHSGSVTVASQMSKAFGEHWAPKHIAYRYKDGEGSWWEDSQLPNGAYAILDVVVGGTEAHVVMFDDLVPALGYTVESPVVFHSKRSFFLVLDVSPSTIDFLYNFTQEVELKAIEECVMTGSVFLHYI